MFIYVNLSTKKNTIDFICQYEKLLETNYYIGYHLVIVSEPIRIFAQNGGRKLYSSKD